MRYPKRHSTYGRVKVKTIQLFLGKYRAVTAGNCYTVTVLQFPKGFSIPKKYFYIYIYKYRVNF